MKIINNFEHPQILAETLDELRILSDLAEFIGKIIGETYVRLDLVNYCIYISMHRKPFVFEMKKVFDSAFVLYDIMKDLF